MPFKIRTKLIFAFLAIIIPYMVISGTIFLYNMNIIYKGVNKVEAVAGEMKKSYNLQLALDMALMPINDYIITGEKRYMEEFRKTSLEVERWLKELEGELAGLEGLFPAEVKEEKEILNDIRASWQKVKEMSLEIFAIPNPVGNSDAARLMEDMDYKLAYPAIERLRRWQEIDKEEYREAHEESERALRLVVIIMIAGGVILAFIGGFFAIFYSRMFVRPIETIHERVDAIAGGDFKTRLDIKTDDEIEQLANAVNEMAAQLDSFTSNLQGMIEERTAELRESEEHYRGVFEKTPNAIVIFDAETLHFEKVNRGAVDLYGYTEEEFRSLTPPDVSAEVEKTRKAVQDGLAEKFAHVPVRYHKKKDGTVFPIEIFMGTFLSNGRQKGFAVIVDLTAIKKNEEMLKASEERFRTITNTAGDAIICLEAPGNINLWNKKAEEMFGYTADEVMGRDMHDLIVPEKYREKAREGLKGFFQTGAGPVVGKTVELTALRKDGTEFPIALSISAMKIQEEWQTTGIIRDITERKKAEDKIKEQLDLLKRFEKVAIDREFRIKELRDENDLLKKRIGEMEKRFKTNA